MTTTRRSALKTASILAAGAALGQRLQAADAQTKGRVNHSVCKWCYPKNSIEELCTAGKEFGLRSVELLQPSDFEVLKKHDMVCAMVSNPTVDKLGGIERAWNRVEHHDKLVTAYEARIKEVADAGFTNLICFSGNRAGLDDEKGIENCALGLKRIMASAEKAKVNIVMELLNSRVNHKDYQCDHTEWGVELCKADRKSVV